MKRSVILFLLVLTINKGFSQLTITPEIGYNISDFKNSAPGTQISTAWVSGFQAGALFTKMGKKGFFIQSGLEFAQKGSYQGRGSQSVYGSNSTIKLNYLQVPINVGLQRAVNKNLSAFASVGVYGALGISGTDKGTSVDISGPSTIDRKVTFSQSESSSDNTKTYIKTLDSGYDLAAGVTYKSLLFKVVYTIASGSVSPIGTISYKNEVVSFTLGYTLPLK